MKNEWKKGEFFCFVVLLFFHGMNSTTPAFWFPVFPSLPPQSTTPPQRKDEERHADERREILHSHSPISCVTTTVLLLVLYLLCFIFFTSLRSFSTASRFIALKGETIKSRGPTKSWTARGRNHSSFFCCFLFCFKCFGSSLPKDRRRRRKTAGLFRVSSVGRPPPQRAVALYSVAV